MTSDNRSADAKIGDFELATMRNNLNLLRSQLKAGRLDEAFLIKQIDKMGEMFERIASQQRSEANIARFEALYNVSRVLGSSLDLQIVLDQVMDAIIQLTRAERGFLMLRDDDGGLTVKAARNFDQQTLGGEQFKYSRTIANQVLDTGLPVLTTNAAEDPRFSGQASIVGQSLRSIMATPLRARGNVIGVVYVDNRALSGLFKQEDLEAMDALSGQAAVALDNAILFNATDRQLQQRVEELQQLRRVDLLLNETLDADKAMFYTLEWACRVAYASAGYLGLIDGEPPRVQTMHHYGIETASAIPANLEAVYPEVNRVIQSGRPATFTADNETILMMPIRREQAVIGLVVLKHPQGEPFSDDQQDRVARVIARAAVAIENARLYAAVKAADLAKSEFVGVVAHDLKAPMNGIQGYAQLMLYQGGLTEKQSDYLERIRDTVQRMEILVSDLADISRIESGHFFMDEARVTVHDIVEAVKDNTLPQIQARRHTLIEQIQPSLPDMHVDYYRLLQVLTNLVSNAYKYTPDGGTITLSASLDGERIRFQVADTGIGLSEDSIAKLGTKFWRADDKYTRSQQGTGLGFSITRHLVEQMGSHIQIESVLGQGSAFSFSVAVYHE
ncbi:MAG: GAF domain-containing protein [bacterium]|nr:GAF domain-containing protein [bacterium]